MRVAIFGGQGFLGGRIAEALVEVGVDVISISRRPPKLIRPGIQHLPCDVLRYDDVVRALSGVTHVVDCVAIGANRMPDAAGNISRAAVEMGVAGLVYVSSAAVYGAESGTYDERSETGRRTTAYGTAKVRSEAVVEEVCSGVVPLSVLRPAIIIGPGSTQWTYRIGRLLETGRLGHLSALGEGWCNLIHVDDVARSAVTVLNHPQRVLNLAIPEDVTWNQYFKDVAELLATPLAVVPASRLRLERIGAYPLRLAQIATRGSRFVPIPLSPNLIDVFKQKVRVKSALPTSGLGLRPYISALQDSVNWFRSAPTVTGGT